MKEKKVESRKWIPILKNDFLHPGMFIISVQRIGLMINGSLFRNGRGGPSNVVGTPPSQNVDPFTSVPARKLSLLQY